MTKKYHIYAYKHYWVKDDPLPMPYTKDEREYVIEAEDEKSAIKIAEREYGSGMRTDDQGTYLKHKDGSWTIMGVKKVEVSNGRY